MPQVGWSVRWEDGAEDDYSWEDLIEWAKQHPQGFDYSPGMLMLIRENNEKLRDYISPTMLPGCPREQALMRLTDYYVLLSNQYAAFRGTLAHKMMEAEWNEPDAILEQQVEVPMQMADGKIVWLKGTPDKVVPNGDGTWTLVDYKSIDKLEASPKNSWVAQLNVYIWMLKQAKDMTVTRAFIMQISMKAPRRTEIPLWPLAKTEAYIRGRIVRFLPVLGPEAQLDLNNLPPMLDPVLDAESTWRCYHKDNWCPVREICYRLHEEGK